MARILRGAEAPRGLNIGQHVVVTTQDGHTLRGHVSLVAPDRVWLKYESGIHVIYRDAIQKILSAGA